MPRTSVRGISYVVTQGNQVKNQRPLHSYFWFAWLTVVLYVGLAVPVLARFEVGDPMVGFLSASALVAIVLGVGTYIALMSHPGCSVCR